MGKLFTSLRLSFARGWYQLRQAMNIATGKFDVTGVPEIAQDDTPTPIDPMTAVPKEGPYVLPTVTCSSGPWLALNPHLPEDDGLDKLIAEFLAYAESAPKTGDSAGNSPNRQVMANYWDDDDPDAGQRTLGQLSTLISKTAISQQLLAQLSNAIADESTSLMDAQICLFWLNLYQEPPDGLDMEERLENADLLFQYMERGNYQKILEKLLVLATMADEDNLDLQRLETLKLWCIVYTRQLEREGLLDSQEVDICRVFARKRSYMFTEAALDALARF